MRVDQCAAKSVAGHAALPVTEFDQPALASESLRREFPAVLASHSALNALDDRRNRGPVILELLDTVGDLDTRAPADVFVVGALVGVLKASPAANVVHQDDFEIGEATFDVLDQLLQGLTSVDAQAALAVVGGAKLFRRRRTRTKKHCLGQYLQTCGSPSRGSF